MRYSFDETTVDSARREILVGVEEVHVEPLEFDVLVYLLENNGRVVPKEELLDSIWGDRFVSESALTTRIKAIRRAVGDDGRAQRVIKTFHGRGYRFIADVEIAEHHRRERTSHSSPVPTAPVAPRTALPRRRADVVGRSAEVAQVRRCLEDNDLVSIVGPGGVGKTTLAIDLGHELSAELEDRVVLCELAGVAHDRILDAIAGAIDGVTGVVDTTTGAIAERLGHDPVMLILDNCEHLVDAIAPVVEDLLEVHRLLTILVTSREPLDVDGERVIRLGGLEITNEGSSAAQLFAIRAGDHLDGQGDPRVDGVVAQIVRQLDGLPLAIELAAAHLRTMTPAELLTALENQMALLRARRTRVERHSTMYDTIDWSFRLLDELEQQTLLELSVFVGSFTSEAAQAVTGAQWAVPVLHRLVEQSVVSRVAVDGSSRYRLLEPIRQYLQLRIDEGGEDLDDVARRHAEYFAARANSVALGLRSHDEPTHAAHLNREWADLAVATAWGRANRRSDIAVDPIVALNFHILWQLRIEAYRWLELAADIFGEEVTARREVAVVRSMGAWTSRDFERSESLLAGVDDEDASVAFARFNQLMARGAFAELIEHIERFRALADDDPNPMWRVVAVATTVIGAAMAAPESPDTDRAWERASELEKATSWSTGRCWLRLAELTLAVRRGDAERVRAARVALEREGAAAHVPWFAMTAGGLAGAQQEQTGPTSRLETAVASMQIALDAGDLVQMPNFLRSLVVGLADAGEAEIGALVLGLVPTIHGLGESGEFTPGYDDAAAWVEGAIEAARLEELAAEGRRLSLDEACALARGALERHVAPADHH